MGWESVGEEDEAGFLEAVDLDVGRTWEEEEEEDDEDCREEREVMLSLFMGERGSAGGEEIGEVDGLLAGDSSIRLLCSMLPELISSVSRMSMAQTMEDESSTLV